MARKRGTVQSSGYTILVIDDQEEILLSVKMLLEREGHQVLTAQSGPDGLVLFRQHPVQLVIVDFFMPRMTGEDVVREIRKFDPDVQILLQTGYSGEKPPLAMVRALDIQGYHNKTDGPDRLMLWVEAALKAATQLQKVREAEQLKLLVKQQFLTNVSHEMRTPLHLILGYSEWLLEQKKGDPLPEDVCQAITGIHRHGCSLRTLVNNFLNYTKIEAEAMEVSLQAISLTNLEAEMRETTTFLLRDKPVSFVWDVDPSLPLVWIDREKLAIILRNLLSNAAKFTAQGEIRVSAVARESAGDAVIAVADTGPGIAPHYHTAVFEVFRQVGETQKQNPGGIGLGLALARRLARLMGGDLTVDSTLGAGATFTLTLPLASIGARAASPSSMEAQQELSDAA